MVKEDDLSAEMSTEQKPGSRPPQMLLERSVHINYPQGAIIMYTVYK